MRSILFVLFVCFLQTVNATTYYFSAISGDDSRTPTEAKNSSTPWKSLNKLNSVFSSLQPGDAVLLKRGETFFGSIIVNKSGTSGSPIIVGAYGSGNKPVITSLVKLTNWISKGNGIYESYNSSLGAAVSTVLLNGVPQELGRFPNSNASNKGYLMYEGVSGTTSITDNNLTSAPNWTGADLVIRARRWITAINRITSHSGTKISYKASTSYAPFNNQGYFVENSIKTLDKVGEWYYNPSTKKLSVYFGSNSPSAYSVQASTGDNLISSLKFNDVIIDNLVIKGANSSGISIKYGANMQVTNCDIMFSGQFGIRATYHPNFKVENNTVSYSNYGGINLGYSGDNAVIRNNKITNTYIFAGMGGSGDGFGIGIFSNGNNNIIEYNQIINTGYIGITFNGNYVTIKNNFIDNFCITKDDGSGIYTYTGTINTTHKGRKLIGNVIVNGKGAWEGTSLPVHYMANGIYLDNGTSGVEVTDNTIGNCATQGVYIHCAHEITMKNNTIFNSGFRHLAMIERTNHPKIRNCNILNNILFANYTLLTAQKLVSRVNADNDNVDLFGKFSGNYYARPLDDQASSFLQKIQQAEPYAKLLSFVNPTRFEYNGTKDAKTISLDAVYTDVKNNKYSGSLILKPFTSVVLIKSNQSRPNNTSPVVSITSPAANTNYKTGATINMSAAASEANGSISKVEFYRGTTLLKTEYNAPYTCSWQNAAAGNYTLTAKATDNSGHVTISKGVPVSVTSSSSSSPVVSLTDPHQSQSYNSGTTIKIAAKATDADGSISKVQFYRGATLLNTQYKYPYGYYWQDMPAGKYTITAKATDNSGHVTTSAAVSITVTSSSNPTVNITSPSNNTSYKEGATINISANAKDAGGSIKKVEFYKGTTLLTTEYNSLYSWNWKNVDAGNYTITAKATDNSGHVTTSSPVYIKVVKVSNRSSDNNGTSDIVNNSDTINAKGAIIDKAESASFDFSLFPNPAVNTIKVSFYQSQVNQKANLSVQSISGSTLKNTTLILSGKTVEIDISSLPPGTYFIRLTGNNFGVSKKFVKMN